MACSPEPAASLPSPSPTPAPRSTPSPTPAPPPFAGPPPPLLSVLGLALIYQYEVGGQRQYERNPHAELPDLRYSGVTVGIGYDLHQYSKQVIMIDWGPRIPAPAPSRFAATQPFYGLTAQAPWRQVRDILVPWAAATGVFLDNDVAREFSAAKRAFPKFEGLRSNAQAALIANGFARGYSTAGPNRTEIRVIRDLVPLRDYAGIAAQLRAQERVWRGTSVYKGLRNRVNAEAVLCEIP